MTIKKSLCTVVLLLAMACMLAGVPATAQRQKGRRNPPVSTAPPSPTPTDDPSDGGVCAAPVVCEFFVSDAGLQCSDCLDYCTGQRTVTCE